MAYQYPTAKTGTAQDLLTVVTRAYEGYIERERLALPDKTSGRKLFLEAPFIVLGMAIAGILEILPAELVLSFHNKLFGALAAPKSYPFDPNHPALLRARDLAEKVERRTGKRAALVALISHPPVLGDLAHMNFELVRHASHALRLLRRKPCKPRIVAAIDPFALDTVSLPVEGVYAGFMGTYHLGFDRLTLIRRGLTRMLLRRAAWYRLVHRLITRLKGGGEAGMVLAGGVPSTTRTLYAVREWVGRMRRKSPLRVSPAEILKRLRAVPEFARFEAQGPHGDRLAASAWRLAEAWAMASLAGVYGCGGGVSCVDTGALSEASERELSALLKAVGVPDAEAAKSLQELKEELLRETPYRARLFRALAARIVGRGTPAIVLPIVHKSEAGALGIEPRDAWAWTSAKGGRIEAVSSKPGAAPFSGSAEDFALLFGRENFK